MPWYITIFVCTGQVGINLEMIREGKAKSRLFIHFWGVLQLQLTGFALSMDLDRLQRANQSDGHSLDNKGIGT
jgi:hypothetical protein